MSISRCSPDDLVTLLARGCVSPRRTTRINARLVKPRRRGSGTAWRVVLRGRHSVLELKHLSEILGPPGRFDLVLVNAPLKDYSLFPRSIDFTLPTLGLAYIATYATSKGFRVGVLDAEALGLTLKEAADLVNRAAPRWVGMNLLAPTYKHSVSILRSLSPEIQVMLGGHHAKAMPTRILNDHDIPRIDAMI